MSNQLTLEQAIQHADERAATLSGPCAAQHAQLAAWLRELQERRKADSEPVAWRYRHHNGLAPSIWKYVDGEQECNAAPNYQRQPLYTAPPALVVPDDSTCKYCGGTGYFRWQKSANTFPYPCMGCDLPAAPKQD